MAAPPFTQNRKTLISNTVYTLLNARVWSAGRTKGYPKRMRVALITLAVIALASIVTATAMFFVPGFVNDNAIAFFSMLVVGIAATLAFLIVIAIALLNTRRTPDEPFLFYDGTRLWLLIPDENRTEEQQGKIDAEWTQKALDRYDLIAVRERLHGPSEKMSSVQIEDMLHVAGMVDAYKMGEPSEGWTLDEVEEIELVESDEKSGTTKIVYTDAISDENRTLTLDSHGWSEFLSWLDSEDPSSIGDDELF